MSEDLVIAVLEARRRERERLAKALHDGAGQFLTAAGLELDLVRMDAGGELASRIGAAQHTLEKAFDSVRRLSHEVHPDPVQKFGLAPAFGRLGDYFKRRWKGEWKIDAGIPADCGVEQGRGFYDIAELALDNIERHSQARRAWLAFAEVLEIGDDGRGFDPGAVRLGLGLLAMPVIARRAGLRYELSGGPGRGTIIQVGLL